ncbi:hypothetical protein ACFYOT_25620 [Saccharothrix saharensis]|uniref:hypothetical protein n=1 Tax=Saccharothrix saharensis TaxID=571190 RepID=UPI00367E0220
MHTTVRTRALHWALVWAVALAVVGMHHLSAHEAAAHSTTTVAVACCGDGHTSSSQEHEPAPSDGHGMLHLCLAVLCVALGLGLFLLLMRRRAVVDLLDLLSKHMSGPRAPPPRPRGTPAVLASLCVLRL